MNEKHKTIGIVICVAILLCIAFVMGTRTANHDTKKNLERALSDGKRLESELREAETRIADLLATSSALADTNRQLKFALTGIGSTVNDIEQSGFIFASTTDRYGFLVKRLESIVKSVEEGHADSAEEKIFF